MSNSREITATIVGAIVGSVVGYLFFTDRGRRVRRQIEPAIDEFARELTNFRESVQKATGVASESWQALTETLGETEPAARYPGRQTSPF